ncbi:rhodanese-like domain-containing protein [Rubrobacter aplysinae]|uniref:rhodanese-like domain-containing protein n=1 Tax=Rubrobacter aplysinae TaxID=909625 RepID=UPI00064C32B3|nr:rhodanese-like domain-containing protein [Rubrobacter aplysinae]
MAKTYEDLVAEARENAGQTDVDEVKRALDSGEEITIVDVREPAEYDEGHLPGAIHVPRGLLEYRASTDLPDKNRRMVTHCALGGRGALAASTLTEMGYTNVANMQGGINGWREQGYEVES